MIDFPIDELLDEEACLIWIERHLHRQGVKCPHCGTKERRPAQQNGDWPAWRCQACDRYYWLLTGTVFEKTHQRPSKVVWLLRGIATGEPTARLARELKIGRARVDQVRQQIEGHLLASQPREPLADEVLEADELYQNAGKKSDPHRSNLVQLKAGLNPAGGVVENKFLVTASSQARYRKNAPAFCALCCQSARSDSIGLTDKARRAGM